MVGNRQSPADEPSERTNAGSRPQSPSFRLIAASIAPSQSITPKQFVFFSQISPVSLSVTVPLWLSIKRGSGMGLSNRRSAYGRLKSHGMILPRQSKQVDLKGFTISSKPSSDSCETTRSSFAFDVSGSKLFAMASGEERKKHCITKNKRIEFERNRSVNESLFFFVDPGNEMRMCIKTRFEKFKTLFNIFFLK